MGLSMIWIIICIVNAIIDIATSSFLFIWFTFGGLSALIANNMGYSPSVQVGTFVLVSILFIIIGYPLVKQTIKKNIKKVSTQEEKYIGKVLKIEKDIEDKILFKIDGIYWTLKNSSKENIKSGTNVKIIGIEGNKLLIKKVEG